MTISDFPYVHSMSSSLREDLEKLLNEQTTPLPTKLKLLDGFKREIITWKNIPHVRWYNEKKKSVIDWLAEEEGRLKWSLLLIGNEVIAVPEVRFVYRHNAPIRHTPVRLGYLPKLVCTQTMLASNSPTASIVTRVFYEDEIAFFSSDEMLVFKQ